MADQPQTPGSGPDDSGWRPDSAAPEAASTGGMTPTGDTTGRDWAPGDPPAGAGDSPGDDATNSSAAADAANAGPAGNAAYSGPAGDAAHAGPAGYDPDAWPTVAGYGQSRYQLDPDDTPTLPRLFTQGSPPPGFWDAPRSGSGAADPDPAGATGIVPGLAEDQVPLGTQVASTLPPRSDRRRGALIGVGLVALATVLVVVAALLIGPHLGSSQADDTDRSAVPPPTPTAGAVDPTSTDRSSTPTRGGTTGSSDPTDRSGGADEKRAAPQGVVTVTVTASPGTAAPTTKGPGSKATGTKTSPTKATVKASSKAKTSTSPTTKAADYGVPTQQIACGDGYIVQLASELTPQAFTQRIASLKQQGLVPQDAKAADSTKSCQLFTNQTNTLILYAGPFRQPYDACQDRIAGPYDAFIKGASPETASDFVSCICPVRPRSLPRFDRVGTHGQWVGELQRMLASHLRYRIDDLGIDTWGVYTPGTKAAVQRFQTDNRLPGNGRVDSRTWSKLQSAGC
jgi:hypothetical protein